MVLRGSGVKFNNGNTSSDQGKKDNPQNVRGYCFCVIQEGYACQSRNTHHAESNGPGFSRKGPFAIDNFHGGAEHFISQ